MKPYGMHKHENALVSQRMCHDKRTYLDEVTANVYAPRAERKTGKPMRAYQCPNCRFWHLTSKPKA